MFSTIRIATIMTVTAMSAVAASSIAIAAPADDARSTVVSFKDLDLKTEAGVARLNQRVRIALNDVCGSAAGTRDLAARTQEIACRKTALDKATANVELAVAAARSDTQLADLSAPSVRVGAR